MSDRTDFQTALTGATLPDDIATLMALYDTHIENAADAAAAAATDDAPGYEEAAEGDNLAAIAEDRWFVSKVAPTNPYDQDRYVLRFNDGGTIRRWEANRWALGVPDFKYDEAKSASKRDEA